MLIFIYFERFSKNSHWYGGTKVRKLLKTKERRQLEIIEFLLEAQGWNTITELATIFNYSPRIIKADITDLRERHSDFQFETGYLGVRIAKKSTQGIQSIYSEIISKSLTYQLLEEIFFDETLSVDELADMFFVSSSTIYRTISQINDYFNLRYHCYVVANPCRFIGNEQNIRLFYRTYFSEKNTVLEWPFLDTDENQVNQLFDKILSFITSEMAVDFAYYEDIKLVVLVNLIRYKHHHLVNTSEEESDMLNLFLQIYKYTIQPLGMKSSILINKESFYQIFGPYIRKDAAKNIKQLQKFKKKSTNIGEGLRFLENSIRDFSKELDLPIDVDYVLFGVYNTAINAMDLLNSDFILYNRYKYFVRKFAEYMPEFYQVFLSMIQGFCEGIRISTNEKTVNYLLFTLITYLDDLISTYNQKHLKVSLVILSDLHFSHSKMIKNLLETELPQVVSIDIFEDKKISVEKLENTTYDIIISTFTLPKIKDKKVVVIQDFPTAIDLANIKRTINDVRKTYNRVQKISESILV